ncbi:hypothetical protein XAUB_19510 [Xanthomonas citri pv. aurantifolii str. ICPB 11122]|nr:hypothetical protein XAUB_19510 [Xanthomonas citri pv. aurantifolii str. ICPB 11122]
MLDVAGNHGQDVVEVVRDPAGQLTHCLDLLTLPECLLGLPACGGFHRFGHHRGDRSLVIEQGTEREVERAPASGQIEVEFVSRCLPCRCSVDCLGNGATHVGRTNFSSRRVLG